MSNQWSTVPSWTAIELVARRELRTRVRSRAFLGGLATTMLLVTAVFGIGRLLDDGPAELSVGLVGPQPTGLADLVEAVNQTGRPGADGDEAEGTLTLVAQQDRAVAEAALESGELDAIVVDGEEVVVDRMSDDVANLVLPVWQQARLVGELADAGTDPSVLTEAQAPLTVTEISTDGDQDAREGLAIGAAIVLFVAIQVGGSFLMMGVLEEKGTKVIEIVLSSIRPRDLLAGKLLGIGVVGLIQVLVMAGTTVLASGLFDSGTLSALSPTLLAVGVAWFLVGYLLWGSLYAAAASLATGMEDAQSTLAPVTIGVLISYFLATFAATEPSSVTARVASWMPFVSPFAMPARMAADGVPWWEVLGALGLAVAATAGVLTLAERIYVRSVLQLDRRVTWRDAIRNRVA